MSDALTQSESRIVNAVLEGLRKQGIMPQRFPDLMSTADIAKLKGCTPKQVTIKWREWGLQFIGKGKSGQMRFSGLSVQRHIEKENA